MQLSSNDYVRIAGVAIVSPQTVRRVYRGGRCEDNTRERIRRAAEKLGYPPPPSNSDPERKSVDALRRQQPSTDGALCPACGSSALCTAAAAQQGGAR